MIKTKNLPAGIVKLIMLVFLFTISCEDPEDTLVAPVVEALQLSNITENSVEAEAIVSGSGITSRGFVYNTEGAPTTDDSFVSAREETGTFSAVIDELEPNTEYFVRAFATNEAGTSYGTEKSFSTLESVPDITAFEVNVVSSDSVVVSATVEGENVAAKGAIIGENEDITVDDSDKLESLQGPAILK